MQNSKRTTTVALDVMGADSTPESIMSGGFEAAREMGDRLKLVLVGKEEVIKDFTDQQKDLPENIIFENADYAVAMSDAPTEGIRKRNSSISIGLKMQKEGRADAFVSAGNTGAVMATSIVTLGKIEGVTRPAIVGIFPTVTGKPALVVDVGANVDCKPMHLYQFGIMGSIYASLMTGRTSPRVGLLSIGEEKSKGNEQTFQTWEQSTSSWFFSCGLGRVSVFFWVVPWLFPKANNVYQRRSFRPSHLSSVSSTSQSQLSSFRFAPQLEHKPLHESLQSGFIGKDRSRASLIRLFKSTTGSEALILKTSAPLSAAMTALDSSVFIIKLNSPVSSVSNISRHREHSSSTGTITFPKQ